MSKDLFNLYHESLIEIKIISQIYYLFSWWSQPHCQFLLTIEYYWGSDICLWTYRGRNNIFLFFSFFNRQALYISILLVVNYRNWNLPNLSQKEKSNVQALCRKSRNGWVLGKTKSKESNKCIQGLSGYSSLLLRVNHSLLLHRVETVKFVKCYPLALKRATRCFTLNYTELVVLNSWGFLN